jgi:hypothetical protein
MQRIPLLVFAASAATLAAQPPAPGPSLRVTAAASLTAAPTTSIVTGLSGAPGSPFAVLFDTGSGPVSFLGREIRLDLSPGLISPLVGTIPQNGIASATFLLPSLPALDGSLVFSQALVIDAGTGTLRTTNGESTVLHASDLAIVERFDAPAAEGFDGNFDPSSRDALRGVLSQRTIRPYTSGQVLDPLASATPFGNPYQPPLDPRGCRAQSVIRAEELAASGETELVLDLRWRPFPGAALVPDAFGQVAIRLAHSTVDPDFTVDSFSALPVFPESGLSDTFANNPSGPEMLVRTGGYIVDPANLTASGYLSWGLTTPFAYNGMDNLLVDIRTSPATATGANGNLVYLAVQSSPLPASSVVASLLPTQPGFLDPNAVTTGKRTNALFDVEIDLLRISSTATSPYRFAGVPTPDYGTPVVATVTPGASEVRVTYSGADDPAGTNATPFDPDVDLADGKPFLQIRIELISDAATGSIPEVDTIVVPVL